MDRMVRRLEISSITGCFADLDTLGPYIPSAKSFATPRMTLTQLRSSLSNTVKIETLVGGTSPDGDVVRLSRTVLYVGTIVKCFFCRTTHLPNFLYVICVQNILASRCFFNRVFVGLLQTSHQFLLSPSHATIRILVFPRY